MARLIDDLLSLSRIELNAHLQPNTPADLAPIVRQVVDGLQTLARDRGVEIKVTAPPDTLMVEPWAMTMSPSDWKDAEPPAAVRWATSSCKPCRMDSQEDSLMRGGRPS